MPHNWNRHFVLDVESDGPHPVSYNMINFGLVCVGNTSKAFLGKVAPRLPHAGIKEARAVSGISYEDQLHFPEPKITMPKAIEWINSVTEGTRAIIWTDNPAYDWQFWNAYCHLYTGNNPGGFSARRIGDFAAGLKGQPLNTNAWKKLRRAPHDHNPVNDALGNAQALRKLLKL